MVKFYFSNVWNVESGSLSSYPCGVFDNA